MEGKVKIKLNKTYILTEDYEPFKRGTKFRLYIKHQTDKAVLIANKHGRQETWLPKSQIQILNGTLIIPWWLLVRKMPVFEVLIDG